MKEQFFSSLNTKERLTNGKGMKRRREKDGKLKLSKQNVKERKYPGKKEERRRTKSGKREA